MTPAETEHFAALRMHVAHLHNALKNLSGELDGVPLTVAGQEALEQAAAVIEISEPDVRELLAEADRDNQLVQARARFAQVNDLSAELAIELAAAKQEAVILIAAAGAVTAAKAAATADPEGPPEDEWVALCRAIDALAEVLPA